MSSSPWLVAIDLQPIFGDPASPWAAPEFERSAANTVRLAEAFGERVVFTRYVAPAAPTGAWVPYFEQWPFALLPPDDPMYALDSRFGVPARVETRERFGKWDAGLAAAVEGSGEIVLAGVSTDCCVLSTALAAADDGIRVRVAADACAAPSDADQERALVTMGMYAPLIEITSVDEVLAGLS